MRNWKRSTIPTRQPLAVSSTSLQRAVIRFAIASTRDVKIPDATFDALKQRMSPTEVVELVAVTAAYNMVARFLVALQVTPET